MTRPQRLARLIGFGWYFHLKARSKSRALLFTTVFQPLMFASVAFFLFKAGHRSGSLLYAALGAGLMGIWSTTLFGAGGAVTFQRQHGTLEPSVGAPTPLVLVMLPFTLAIATIGLYSLVATLVWGRLLFGIRFTVVHPLLFVVALLVTVVALALLGLVLASSFVHLRYANTLQNVLEYPVWLASGLIVPLSFLPGWVEPLSWFLAPTWGVRAVRGAVLGGDTLTPIGMSLLLAAVYLVIGAYLLRVFERLARDKATLSLV